MTQQTMNIGPRVIKKYINRKLYDTKDNHYVTLTDIEKLINKGEEFVIIDNKSKQDMTKQILVKILERTVATNKNITTKNLLHAIKNNTCTLTQSVVE